MDREERGRSLAFTDCEGGVGGEEEEEEEVQMLFFNL